MPHRKTKKPPPMYRGRESKLPIDHIGRLDMIVAEIREIEEHPTYLFNYYVISVDIGEMFSMIMESSLGPAFKEDDLLGRRVVLVNNIKPRWVRTVDAHSLVMVARTGDVPEIVETIIPPDDAEPGDIIHVEGYPRDPDRPYFNPYKEVFEEIMSFIRVEDDLRLIYKNVPLTVQRTGSCVTTAGLKNPCFIDAM